MFDDDEREQQENRDPFMYVGYVVSREDPLNLGRVTVCVPGKLEPESAWALPLGTVGGGAKNRGFFAVPEKGAEVAVFFNQGNVDAPYYISAHWGKPGGETEVPQEAQDSPDVRVFATETFRFEVSEKEDARALRITDLKTEQFLELDAERNGITIRGTTYLNLVADGIINIQCVNFQVNGRKLAQTPDPL